MWVRWPNIDIESTGDKIQVKETPYNERRMMRVSDWLNSAVNDLVGLLVGIGDYG